MAQRKVWIETSAGATSQTWAETANSDLPDPIIQNYSKSSFTIATGQYAVVGKTLQLEGTARATIEGTGTLLVLG